MKGVISVPNSEHTLIEKCKQGDVASFEQLISQYQVYVYNIAYRTLGHEEDAKDASQEALIKVFKSISQFTGDAQFSTWLYRVVMNTCKDYMRKQKSRHEHVIQDEEEATYFLENLADQENNQPEKHLERQLINNSIHSALEQLPLQHKSAVVLRDIQGLSYEEISIIEECSVGTVKSRINRGRKYLREILSKDAVIAGEGGY